MKTCLLVDDDLDDQEIFALALQELSASIQCVVANNSTEAISKLTTTDTFVPDYIFIDLNMPGVNGKQCLEEIRKQRELEHVPVYIYSTSALKKDVMETQMLGATAFITKPASIDELAKILRGVFFATEGNN